MHCLDIPEHVPSELLSYTPFFAAITFSKTFPAIDGAWEWRIYDVGGCRTAVSLYDSVVLSFLMFSLATCLVTIL